MSSRARSQFSLPTSLPQDIAFDWKVPDFRPQGNYADGSNPSMLAFITKGGHFHQSYVGEQTIPEHTPLPWHASQAHAALPMSTHINRQTQRNPTFLGLNDILVVPEPSPNPFSPHPLSPPADDNDMMSAFHSDYSPTSRPYGTYWGSHRTSEPYQTLHSPNRLLFPPMGQDTHDLGYHLPGQLTDPTLSHAHFPLYSTALNHQNPADLLDPNHLPSHQSFGPFPLQFSPYTTSTEYVEPASHVRFVAPRNTTGSSRRKRGARAVEYGGIWIDEEELLGALTEPNGKLSVHQCHWEDDRSACHLWIKGDKSCINTHIQKWHGGKPGGEKLEVGCRWSACGRRMLKESIARHILSIHLGEIWKCQGCDNKIARKDAYERHSVKSDSETCRNAGAFVTYSADVRVIDARAALDSRGRVRYADA